jgi:hypothetical protein
MLILRGIQDENSLYLIGSLVRGGRCAESKRSHSNI